MLLNIKSKPTALRTISVSLAALASLYSNVGKLVLINATVAADIVVNCADKVVYAPINAVVELTPFAGVGSTKVTVVPTTAGPSSTIAMIASKLLLIKVMSLASPAVPINLGMRVCKGV